MAGRKRKTIPGTSRKVTNNAINKPEEKKSKVDNSRCSTKEIGNRKPVFKNLENFHVYVGLALACGSNVCGQLGQHADVNYRKRPQLLKEFNERVKQVAAGAMHTVCLTAGDEVVSFGCNDERALGRDTGEEDEDDKEYEPLPMSFPNNNQVHVVHVSCGSSHTALLAHTGHVHLTGCFRDGSGRFGTEIFREPTLLTGAERVVQIASGYNHLLMLTDSQQVLSVGNAEFGQLGRVSRYFGERGGRRGNSLLLDVLPVRLPNTKEFRGLTVENIFCGADTSLMTMSNQSMVGFGRNYGQILGLPLHCYYTPTVIPSLCNKTWKKLCLSDEHLVALDTEGQVYTMGLPTYGKLGLGPDFTEEIPTLHLVSLTQATPLICSDISAGSQSSYAVTTQGLLYAWGAKENWTGDVDEDEEDEYEYWPYLVPGKQLENRRVLSVSCGSQHVVMKVTDAA